MKFSKTLQWLFLMGLLAAFGAGCAGQTGVVKMDTINVGEKSHVPVVVGHGDASGVDTKAHYLFDGKTGELESAQLATGQGMNKIIWPAVIEGGTNIGAAAVLGSFIGRTNDGGGGGGATVSVEGDKVIQKTSVRQSTVIKGGKGGPK